MLLLGLLTLLMLFLLFQSIAVIVDPSLSFFQLRVLLMLFYCSKVLLSLLILSILLYSSFWVDHVTDASLFQSIAVIADPFLSFLSFFGWVEITFLASQFLWRLHVRQLLLS